MSQQPSSASSSQQQRLMLDVPNSSESNNTVPYELFEASQGQLREAAVALSKHKSSLASALGEVSNLRAMVGALEKNVESLKIQNEDLFQRLRESRGNEEEMVHQVSKLTDTTEFLSKQLQLHAKSSAQRYSALQEMKEQSETNLRVRIERLTNQLLGTQVPQSHRAVPWAHTFKKTEHPAHIVKMIVNTDAQRENRLLRLQLTANATGEEDDGLADLEKLVTAANSTNEHFVDDQEEIAQITKNASSSSSLSSPSSKAQSNNQNADSSQVLQNLSKSSAFAEDANMWKSVCRRLHSVLSERRMLLRTKSDGPLEFLLRSRHEMAAGIVQMREEVRKIGVVLNTMVERMEGRNVAAAELKGSGGGSGGQGLLAGVSMRQFEGSLEVMQTVVSDLSHTVHRAINCCFSDADRILFRIQAPASAISSSSSSSSASQLQGRRNSFTKREDEMSTSAASSTTGGGGGGSILSRAIYSGGSGGSFTRRGSFNNNPSSFSASLSSSSFENQSQGGGGGGKFDVL